MRKELPHSQLKLVLPSRLSSLRIGCRRFRLGLSYSVSSEGFLISRHKAATGGDLRLSQKVCSCILAQRIRGSVGLVSGFLRGREPGNYKPRRAFLFACSSADPHWASHSEQRECAFTSAQLQLQYRRPEESSSQDFAAVRPTEPVRNHNRPTRLLEFLVVPLPVLHHVVVL